jgi:multicomponent Na+:H+ antiporter subunit E
LADATLPSAGSKPLRWTTRLVLFALLWLVLVGTDPVSWIVGVPAVLLASYAAARLSTLVGADPRPLRLIAFVPFFVWESVLGGMDVARRVLAPRLRIDPALVSYRPRLKDPAAQVVFLDTISLLPGTLSADIRNGLVQVHALDGDPAMVAGLERLEARVARLFGEEVTGAPIVTVTSCAREDALALARAEAQAAAREAAASAGHDPRKSS